MDHCGSEVYISWTMNSCPEFWKSGFFPDVHGDGTTSLAPLSFQRWNVPHETPLATHPQPLLLRPTSTGTRTPQEDSQEALGSAGGFSSP